VEDVDEGWRPSRWRGRRDGEKSSGRREVVEVGEVVEVEE
jgi:hypothetical protein